MVFFISGCVKRRSTRTTTVLSCLSLTTTPCNVRFGIRYSLLFIFGLGGGLRLGLRSGLRLVSGFGFRLRRRLRFWLRRAGALLRGNGLETRDVAANLARARGVLELARGPLEAQVEALFLELEDFVVHLIERHRSDIGNFHVSYSAIRATKRVLTGSLAAASCSASRATACGMPSTSNRMRPGLTRTTQTSGLPLPLPMRTSIGFFDTGTSGKTRIQTRPARFMKRVSARRAASIWRALTRSGSSALRPYSPNASVWPEVATP